MNLEGVGIGITSGILLLILHWVWRRYVVTWFYYLIKSETPVGGNYQTSYTEDNIPYQEDAKLIQWGRRVYGKITFVSGDEKITYKFSGKYQDRILSGTYFSTDRASFERGAFVLEYKGKTGFKGWQSYISPHTGKVVSNKYTWKRLK